MPIFSGTTTGDEAGTACVVVELTPLVVTAVSTTGIGVGGICAAGSTVGGGVKILPVSCLYCLCKDLLFGARCNACSTAVIDFDF